MFGLPAFIEIFIISLAIGFATSLSYRFLTKPGEMRLLKSRAKECNEKMKAAQKSGDKKEQDRWLGESLTCQRKTMSMNTKPMLASLLIVYVGFYALGVYSEASVSLPFRLPFTTWEFPYVHLTSQYTWFWWYLIIIFPANMIFRKLLGAE